MAKVKQPLEENGIHRAKMWEIMMYALNNTSTNTYMMVVGYISYFLIGIVGLASVLAGSIVTIMRIWDGVTDPFVGMMVDKTNGRFLLYALEQKTGIQTLVVAVKGIEGEHTSCFDFAHRLGQETGVGQKERDNGLVILLSTDERCVQFATGYGLEGILPDAICKRIQNRYMLPYFKDNNWNAGMVAGIRAVNGYLDGSMENIGNDESENDPLEFIIIFFVIFGGFIGIGLYANWRKTRCPHCKKHKLNVFLPKL